MRFYGFGNYYLSSLQQALQAHHVAQEMYNKYVSPNSRGHLPPGEKGEMYDCWSFYHKTIVLLNGGNSKDLHELYDFFHNDNMENPYPFAKFHEDDQSLEGALTSVGIILPEKIYDTAAMDRKMRGEFYPRPILTEFEEELVQRLNQYGLAK